MFKSSRFILVLKRALLSYNFHGFKCHFGTLRKGKKEQFTIKAEEKRPLSRKEFLVVTTWLVDLIKIVVFHRKKTVVYYTENVIQLQY